jgi:hypothetical protein
VPSSKSATGVEKSVSGRFCAFKRPKIAVFSAVFHIKILFLLFLSILSILSILPISRVFFFLFFFTSKKSDFFGPFFSFLSVGKKKQ